MSKIVGELNAEMMKKAIHDRRAKLFAEIVAKTGSKQSVIDRAMQEIESLREQVAALTKERDAAWSVNPTVSENLLREQLAALAEQKGIMMAVQFCIDNPLSDAHCLAEMLRARADELRKTNV